MERLLKDLPLPITGLMLGFAALGNLIQSHSKILRNVFGLVSAIIFAAIVLKLVLYPKEIKKTLEDPVIASVFPTFSMTTILFSTYVKPISGGMAKLFWLVGLILHIILMVSFTRQFILHKNYNIKKVFPSWFIPYVGIAVAGVTSAAVEMQAVGKVTFLFALIAFALLLPVVFRRILVIREMAEPTIPTIGIIAAPASLCLAAYINSFGVKNMALVYILLTIAQVLYWAVILSLPRIIRLPFYPSYSGFTFPLVISGLALKLANGFLARSGKPMAFLSKLVALEELIAMAACGYVLISFISFLFAKRAQNH